MGRPRIEGMDEKIIASFIERKIYANQREVISSALRALVKEQKMKEAAERQNPEYTDATYGAQLDDEEGNAEMGNSRRRATAR